MIQLLEYVTNTYAYFATDGNKEDRENFKGGKRNESC